jgi:hypothetical protein
MPGKASLQLGDTRRGYPRIRESANLALSCAKVHGYELGLNASPNNVFLADNDALSMCRRVQRERKD